MSHARRGEVDVELAGETYSLVFDFNAISEIEERFGDRPINELMVSPAGGVSMRFVREALRVGLDRRNKKLTSKQVGNLIDHAMKADPDALGRIIKAIVDGISGAFGPAPEQDQKQPEEKRPTEAPETGGG